jgi:O-antigen ligase
LKHSFQLIQEKPLLGYGVYNSRFFLKSERIEILKARGQFDASKESTTYSHSNYTEMLLNGGIFAFSLYYFPLLYILFKNKKHYVFGKLINFLVLFKFLADITRVSYYDFLHSFLFAFIIFLYFYSKDFARNDKYSLSSINTK